MSSDSYGKGPKGTATRLHSLIIRARLECERCGYQCPCPEAPRKHTSGCRLQCSHVISRRYNNTRTDERNAFCLCASCHSKMGDNPIEHGTWALEQMGELAYDDLRERANATTKMDWPAEVDRLKGIAKRLGIL